LTLASIAKVEAKNDTSNKVKNFFIDDGNDHFACKNNDFYPKPQVKRMIFGINISIYFVSLNPETNSL